MLNQAEGGFNLRKLRFPQHLQSARRQPVQTFGGNGSGVRFSARPMARAINAQSRTFPIPIVKDDFSWQKGRHSSPWAAPSNGKLRTTTPSSTTTRPPLVSADTLTASPPAQRPSDIGGGNATALTTAPSPSALAPYTNVSATYNYDAQGNPVAQGTARFVTTVIMKPNSTSETPGK